MEERECPWCFKPIVQRDDEPEKNFVRRIYCNKTCANYHKPRHKKQTGYITRRNT